MSSDLELLIEQNLFWKETFDFVLSFMLLFVNIIHYVFLCYAYVCRAVLGCCSEFGT